MVEIVSSEYETARQRVIDARKAACPFGAERQKLLADFHGIPSACPGRLSLRVGSGHAVRTCYLPIHSDLIP